MARKGLTRPLSRKAAMKAESFPAMRSMFLGVSPPVTKSPPKGSHFKPAGMGLGLGLGVGMVGREMGWN